jgi:hypothetical protein
MKDFEKLGVFYLGRQSDAAGATLGDPVLYDSRDLLTHALCVGMTGSGKTGLCASLIEEAAIDGVPTIAIDPKGDLSNLLLTFPDLAPADFRPWIDEDEARRAGLDLDTFAAQQAAAWKKGLADWGEDGDRIARLRAAADFSVYTPGSAAGRPLSILSSLAPPTGTLDSEALADRASTAALSVLALAGAEAEPRGREHTFLATLFAESWKAGVTLDLGALVGRVQNPPFTRIGVLDLESFYPAKDRFGLAAKLNAVLAAPGFEQWLEGEPLDPGRLLFDAKGRPRVSIISIAHLDDDRRMFVVSLLLNEIVGWMRRQSGTSSLRAIVYMDEIAGYFPPVSAPPSKGPLLTLLKQARAFGLGIVLATQNTVDLDYKGLGNAGTWFLGRLQTERDKARVLDGLEGAAAGAFDRSEADRTLSSLGKRVFLLHDVHAGAPATFMSRWALSYLRGPLSRDQLRALTPPRGPAPGSDQGQTGVKPGSDGGQTTFAAGSPDRAASAAAGNARPVLQPGIAEYFIPATGANPHYQPVALGLAQITFVDAKLRINQTRDVIAAVDIADGAVPVDWTAAEVLQLAATDLAKAPADGAVFDPLPTPAANPRNYAGWQKAFTTWLSNGQRLDLLRHAGLNLTAAPDESEHDFRVRIAGVQREKRDAEVDAVRRKFADERARLEAGLQRARQGVEREQGQASQAKLQTAVSFGATVLGALLGRKTLSSTNLGRATTAARGFGRAYKESEDVGRAQQTVEAQQKALDDLDAQLTQETSAIALRYDADAGTLDTISVTPKRGQIVVQGVALGWRPGRRELVVR